ncbi:hypothetical protein ACQ4PT_039042 [Festuca glaucescens]
MAGFYGAVRDKMGEHVERLLDRLALERRPEALIIVADTFLTWAVAAGARRGVPVCSLWTQPATFFLALYHLDRWPPVNGQDSDEELSTKSLEQYVPGLSSVRLSDLKIFGSMERSMKIVAEAFANLRKAQCVLFTSFLELEPRAFDTITESLPCPAYPIGPSIASLPLNGDGDKIGDEEHRDWLDAQPENSVLYVSFGSYACGDRGLAVPWCEQLEVLCHPSVGGFLSHCGWTSVLEAVCAGVPLLAFPVVWDQLMNARMVADEWKVGMDLRGQRGEDGTVSRAAISAAVMKLMDFDSDVGREMRRRAGELREDSRRAVLEGGSSHRSLTSFLQDLMEGKPEVTETSP